MGKGLKDINYLHLRNAYIEGKVEYEQGLDWAFDTYIHADTQFFIRFGEIMLYGLILSIYVITNSFGISIAITQTVLYIVLLVLNIQKHSSFLTGSAERNAQKVIASINFPILGLIVLDHFIYSIFWFAKGLSLSAVKFFTWVWYAITLLALLVIFI